jgi:hypothetical protein
VEDFKRQVPMTQRSQTGGQMVFPR